MQQPIFAPVPYKDYIFDTAFHPSQDILATGHVGGTVQLYSVTAAGANRLTSVELHNDSVIKFKFFPSGQYGVTASSDGTCCVIDTNLNKKWTSVACLNDDESDVVALSSLVVHDDNIFVAGDEGGAISVWDTRVKVTKADGPPIEITDHEDTVTDMVLHPNGYELISVSSDGCLGHFDLRKGQLIAMSDPDEDEGLWVQTMRDAKKVVVGCDSGKIKVFSWGDFGDFNDMLVGHPAYVGTHVKVDERLLLTGAGDCVVRLASICPNKIIGAVAIHEHEDEGMTGQLDDDMLDDGEDEDAGGMPLETLVMNHTKDLIATTAHDEKIKVFRVGDLINEARRNNMAAFEKQDREDGVDQPPAAGDLGNKKGGNNKKSAGELRRDEFFSDL